MINIVGQGGTRLNAIVREDKALAIKLGQDAREPVDQAADDEICNSHVCLLVFHSFNNQRGDIEFALTSPLSSKLGGSMSGPMATGSISQCFSILTLHRANVLF